MSEPLLQVGGLKVSYGGIQAVKGIDLEVRPGELVALIGANGAGKTSTLKAITGSLAYAGGDVKYEGKSIQGAGSHVLVGRGLAMVPEGRGVFARMSITENLLMGAYIRNDKAGIQQDIDKMFSIFPRLKERADQLAGTMSGGEQQMLAMARALMSRPRLLLLTSRRWACRRSWCRRSSRWCARCPRRASRSCWSNRTHDLPCRPPIAVM
jgi:branched-chain amino acid transport system ATP-binding protein